MKKTLLTFFCAFTTLMLCAQSAKTYSDQLVVTINGDSTEPQQTNILFTDNGDGTCDFALNNFYLLILDNALLVGNIALEGLILNDGNGYQTFTYDDKINITAGNIEGVSEDMWIGPILGEIPLVLSGKVNENKLYVSIDINMESTLGQIIYVKFGNDDFESGIKKKEFSIDTSLYIYDLQGRRVTKQFTGHLYIKNGKKYVMK